MMPSAVLDLRHVADHAVEPLAYGGIADLHQSNTAA
jgi:hypothetical protein